MHASHWRIVRNGRASMTKHYFPDANEPALQSFTQAFVDMMFAHAAFERRVSDLMGVITDIVGFGERPGPENQRSADQRPKRMKKLIREHRPDGLPETDGVVACLKRAILPCRDRNWLAHGSWWEFDTNASTITVRSGIARANQDQHRRFTAADIQAVAMSLDDLEVELWKLQRAIEARPPPIHPTATRWGSLGAFWRWLTALNPPAMIVRHPSGFIEPCVPSRAVRPAVRAALGSRNLARWLPADGTLRWHARPLLHMGG